MVMSIAAQKAAEIVERLYDNEKVVAFNILQNLADLHEAERQRRNEEYLKDLRISIKQLAEGRGITRDIVEVDEEFDDEDIDDE